MATSPATPQLGDKLSDGVNIFRAFAEKNFRERKTNPPHVVRFWAYLLRADDVADGLSVGITPKASVNNLSRNYGYCTISVGAVTALPDNLSVRSDTSDPEHAFICNLPLLTISDKTRSEAVRIAKELARRSTVVTCDTVPPFPP